jgi:phosphate butyryltransferase
MIRSLDQMVEKVLASGKKHRIAVAWAQDFNTIGAVYKAFNYGFADATLIGQEDLISTICKNSGFDPDLFRIINCIDESSAADEAVKLVKSGEADIVMKGLVGTDKFLKSVMNKERGIMIPGATLSYVGVVEIQTYKKLLFITDTAVIPYPNLNQKIAMVNYAIGIAKQFGIETPKVALIGASEKKNEHFRYTKDYAEMCKMALDGRIKDCIMDGPLDLFLACDHKSPEIKGVTTPVNGDADVLLFPSLESCNPFYKSLMLFAGGEIAGIIRGTDKPVVLMSRSESEKSKYYCIALACLMA